jgi:hypothetical protein
MMPGITVENLMKYKANHVIVDASKIVDVSETDKDGNVHCALEHGENAVADKGMTARYHPRPDDFWVVQSDGYAYLNPREVFERNYSALGDAQGGEAVA